jgi:hypothetical protein
MSADPLQSYLRHGRRFSVDEDFGRRLPRNLTTAAATARGRAWAQLAAEAVDSSKLGGPSPVRTRHRLLTSRDLGFRRVRT